MRNLQLFAALVAATLVAGCSGGGSSSATNPPLTTSTTTTAQGTVTGFGSVFVNGVEWETGNADITVDDQPAAESALKIGHIVVVHGTRNADGTGVADSIEYDAELKGPITAKDTDSITVLGHTVVIDDHTIIDDSITPASIDGLNVGDFVEINGYPTVDGTLHALHIEIETDNSEFEIKGIVASLDDPDNLPDNPSALTFKLNELVIDYTDAFMEDFDGDMIADGNYVEVEGTQLGNDGELIAVKVEREDNHSFAEGEAFELEGFISELNIGSIVVNHMQILIDPNISVSHGNFTDLAVDIRVEVEGIVDADGNKIATHIEIAHSAPIRVEAQVQVKMNTTSEQSLTVFGIVFNMQGNTQIEDDSVLDTPFFNLGDIEESDWVEVRGYMDEASGELFATRVERDDMEDRVRLEGPVDMDGVSGDTVMVLGVTVTTDQFTQLDEDSPFATVAELLASLETGTIVEIKGMQTDARAITALEIGVDD